MRVYIIHRWDGTPDSDWYKWLKKELEKEGYAVFIPEMPDTSRPKIKGWVSHLEKVVGIPEKDTCFVGHSVGCQAIMRYLMNLPEHVKVKGMIFVAGWLELRNLEDEESEEIAEEWLKTPIDFKKVNDKTEEITLFLSDDDPYVNLERHKKLFKEKLNANVVVERGKGHFTEDEGITKVPEVLKEIRRVLK